MSKKYSKVAEVLNAYKQKAQNTINEDEKKVLTELVNELEQVITDAEASEEQLTKEDLAKLVDERVAAAMDKLKNTSTETTENAKKMYLNSKQADHDFVQCAKNNVGNPEGMMRDWCARLSANGIKVSTNGINSVPMPATVVKEWQDAWTDQSNFIGQLGNTGLKRVTFPINTTDQYSEEAEARSHKKGETKDNQTLIATSVTISCQMVFVINGLDELEVYESDTDTIRYIVREGALQLRNKIAKCILVGDGIVGKGHNTHILPIANREEDKINAVTKQVYSDTTPLIKQLRQLRRSIVTQNGEKVLLFCSPEFFDSVCEINYTDGGSIVFLDDKQLANQCRCAGVFVSDFLGAGKNSKIKAIMVRADKYKTTGKYSPNVLQWREPETNEVKWRIETPFGGDLVAPKSAAVLSVGE